MSVTELLNYKKILDEGERIVLEKIKEEKKIDDELRHLHVIDCRKQYSETGDFDWYIVAAALSDSDEKDFGGWVRFIGYRGNIEGVDINKPLGEQIKIKESGATIDCYLKSGDKETDYRPVNKLRELADIIQERYLDGKI